MNINRNLLLILIQVITFSALAQNAPFNLRLELIDFSQAPGLQSYAWASLGDEWLVMGGRIEGLHDHRPPYAFPPSGANSYVHVINPITKQVWSASISNLAPDLKHQLSSTNLNFRQVGNLLILIGGYGYHDQLLDWKTSKLLTRVNIPGLIQAIKGGQNISPHFSSLSDIRMQVTGGQLGYLDSTFYLVFGQDFDGRYNPHNGPSYTQTYTEAIRRFKLNLNVIPPTITAYESWSNPNAFRRRDYNLMPQRFGDGSLGFFASTGVFRQDIDLPFLDGVDIRTDTAIHRSDFVQKLSHYHSARAALYDSVSAKVYNLFFGGMAMYYPDVQGQLQVDSLVPFVPTISLVTRLGDSLYEQNMPVKFPGLEGSGAEFIPHHAIPRLDNDLLVYPSKSNIEVLIGHIYGGIESDQPNIFMQYSGNSWASSKIYEVWLTPESPGTPIQNELNSRIRAFAWPNPASSEIKLRVELPSSGKLQLRIVDLAGRVHLAKTIYHPGPGSQELTLKPESTSAGVYYLILGSKGGTTSIPLIMLP